MTDKHYYVDACCCHQHNKFSWAIFSEDIQEGGSITQEKINTGYCEMYAVYQALLRIESGIIFCDNEFVVRILNTSRKQFEFLMKYRKYKINKDFLCTVYDLYHDRKNVILMKVNRKDNKEADKLARSFKNW